MNIEEIYRWLLTKNEEIAQEFLNEFSHKDGSYNRVLGRVHSWESENFSESHRWPD